MKTGNIIVIGYAPTTQGGIGPLTHDLLINLQSVGHRVRAICPIFPDNQDWRGLCAERYPRIPVTWFEMPNFGNPIGEVPIEELEMQLQGIEAALRPMVAEEPADLIYLHKESFIWGLPPLARRLDLRILATTHGVLAGAIRGAVGIERPQDWLNLYARTDLVTCPSRQDEATLRAAGLDGRIRGRAPALSVDFIIVGGQ